MKEPLTTKETRQRAGHQEILGETLAKFEFFQHGWYPYSRFLDVDKVDLILRRRRNGVVEYRDVQVKFGKLYTRLWRWDRRLFSVTSWRFFSEKNLDDLVQHDGLYVAYVLSLDKDYRGDIFIFPVDIFVDVVRRSDKLRNGKYCVYISKTAKEPWRWFVRRKRRKFTELDDSSVVEVSEHYRNFGCLDRNPSSSVNYAADRVS